MSAIAGIIRFDGRPVDRATLDRMGALLTPYGKDTQQHSHQGTVAMLRTLLRTTPEDSFDRQPLIHAASGTTLVFDGRIDNRAELAHSLGLTATETALMADSDLVLRACLRWETQAVDRLLGDFALACWQAPHRRLWLARDPLGVRPLFWHQQADFFAFATMPKALFAIPGIPRALCEERLHDYLCLMPMTGAKSFFKDVYRIEPGQRLVLENGQNTTQYYSRFDPNRTIKLSSDDDYVEAFREHLDRAVACRLRSSGRVASELSSGLDSSTVTAIAARQLAQRGERLIAFTAVPREGFNGPVLKGRHGDEGPGARALAAQFDNIDHILIPSDGSSPIEHLKENVEILDRAPLNCCNLGWMNAIQADAARRGAKVLLNGAMGNNTISYDGSEYLVSLLGRGQWVTLGQEIKALKRRYPKMTWRWLVSYLLSPYLPVTLWAAFEKRRGRGWNLTDYSAIDTAFMTRMRTTERARHNGHDFSFKPKTSSRALRLSALTYLDNGDHFAAANVVGLELRDPTADRRLVEFCLAIPEAQYWHRGQSSWLLRRLMGNTLPPEILECRTKGLQAADWYESVEQALPNLREELTELMAHRSVGNYLDLEPLMKSLDDWPKSGWEDRELEQTYRLKLLRGLSVGTFIRYVDDTNNA